MSTNLERFKKDLEKLITTGRRLELAMQHDCLREEFEKQVKKQLGKGADAFIKDLPSFKVGYQKWYSEALSLLSQLLPNRVADFVRHYEKPKGRKDITYENYRIEDYLQGLNITKGYYKEKVVGPDAALPQLAQQFGRSPMALHPASC